jgi:PAS domain S-box-containing protein
MMLCLMEPRLEFPCQAPPHNNRQSLAHNCVRRSEKRVIGRRTPALSMSRTKMSLREGKCCGRTSCMCCSPLFLTRRDRNREHAKQSRIRKRVLLDTLQDQLTELRAQNAKLRRVVADRLPPELASQVLLQCTTEESTLLAPADESDTATPSNGHAAANNSKANKDSKILMEPDYRLMHSLIHSQQNFLLTDPAQPDNPIVYVSEGFCKLTGYKRTEVLGRNCRFLQGPGTDPTAVKLIRQGIAEGRDVSVCLLNYRADGSAFWNQFFLAALKDAQGKIVNYVGVQCAANTLPVESLKQRVKRLPLPGV